MTNEDATIDTGGRAPPDAPKSDTPEFHNQVFCRRKPQQEAIPYFDPSFGPGRSAGPNPVPITHS